MTETALATFSDDGPDAEIARLTKMLAFRARQCVAAHEGWCLAAEEALAGRSSMLRDRVHMHRARHARLVRSAEQEAALAELAQSDADLL